MDNENAEKQFSIFSFRIMSITVETNMTTPAGTQEAPKDCLADVMATIMDQDPPVEVNNVEAWWPTWDKEYACDSMDSSLYKKQGCIFQFINNNALGMASMIGGIRIGVTDIRKMPQYIIRNKSHIKNHAIKLLNHHLIETQCSVGYGEALSQDEYGMSYSLASVSHQGLRMHPTGRQEGSIFFCLFDGLIEPVILCKDNNDRILDSAYIFNVYINLLPPSQRRNALLRQKAADEQKQASEAANPPQKKSKGTQTSTPFAAQPNQQGEASSPEYQSPGNSSGYSSSSPQYIPSPNYQGSSPRQHYQGSPVNPGYQGSYPNNINVSRPGYQGKRINAPTGPTTEDLAKKFDSLQYNAEERFKRLEAQQVPMPPLPQPAPIWPNPKAALPDE